MKYFIICMLIIIAGCSDQKPENSLNGTYVGYAETEYGKMEDTLFVTKANEGGYIFQIEKHTGGIKKLEGKEFPKELIIETWTLEFDPVKQTLFELKGGKTLVWNNENKTLQLGEESFRQIAKKSD